MKSIREQIKDFANEIESSMSELILKQSRISQWNHPESSVLLTLKNFKWEALSQEGVQLQSKVFEEYGHFSSLLRVLLAKQPDHIRHKFNKSADLVNDIITQSVTTVLQNTQQAHQRVCKELHEQVALIDRLYDGSGGARMFVPDTNALLYNPDLEKWNFNAVPIFTIVLTPTVLSELDHHKINHRNEDVRKKADGLIGRIKDYRRRGRLSVGVPIKRDKITVMAIAKEPNFSDTLPWLDANSDDDRYLASFLEVMRTFASSITVLVTRDINLQNKAEFSRVPFLEPPNP